MGIETQSLGGNSGSREPGLASRPGPSGFDPGRKKARRKPRDHFIKRRKHAVSLKKGTGGINPCWTPSNEASKADLIEFHNEELRLRRRRQLARQSNSAGLPRTKNDDPAYRKSIWPAAKIASRAGLSA